MNVHQPKTTMYVEPVTSFLKNIFHWTNGFPPGSWLAVCALWIWDLVALKWWGGHIYWYFTVDCLTFSIELTLSRTVDHLGHPLLYTPEERCPTFQPTLLLLSRFSCVQLCATPDGSPPGSPSLGFSRQEHWSGLPFPSPMHESEKWKWSRSVMSEP